MVDPCCCCPTTETLDVVVVGFTDCGCIPGSGILPPGYKVVSHTGITGSYTVTLSAPNVWTNAAIGTLTFEVYTTGTACADLIDTVVVNVGIFISCENGELTVIIAIMDPIAIDRTALFNELGTLDEVINNTVFSCDGLQAAFDDSVTVSLP